MINVVCGIRSTGRICTDLAAALEQQGHEVKIAYGREEVPAALQKYAVRIGSDFDVKLHGLRARLSDGCGWGSKRATAKFLAWVRDYNPDVIHLHNLHGYYINLELLFGYLRGCGKKIIWTLHDCWAFTGHSAYCDAVKCERWIHGCYDCPNRREYPASLTDHSRKNWEKKRVLMDQIPNMTIVTPSKWLAGLVKKSFLCHYEVKVIHNGINTAQFYPLENDFKAYYGIEGKHMILGVSSSWNDKKVYSDYLKLADTLGDGYQVVLYGLTKQQKETLPPSILGIERTDSVKEVAQIYDAADVCVDLSQDESHGMTNMEERLCTIPVITYASSDCVNSSRYEIIAVPRSDLRTVVKEIESLVHLSQRSKPSEKADIFGKSQKELKTGYWACKDEFNLIGQKVIIGVAAIWDKRKGLEDVIALSHMIEDPIVIVGVNERNKKLIPSNIRTVTKTSDVEELRMLYGIADVLVNTSYEDNFPTINLEAISCNTPVVTYDTGGSPESAAHYGIVVDQGNLQELALAISAIGGLEKDQSILDDCLYVKHYIDMLTGNTP